MKNSSCKVVVNIDIFIPTNLVMFGTLVAGVRDGVRRCLRQGISQTVSRPRITMFCFIISTIHFNILTDNDEQYFRCFRCFTCNNQLKHNDYSVSMDGEFYFLV